MNNRYELSPHISKVPEEVLGQLALPLDVRPLRKVRWCNVEESVKNRFFGLVSRRLCTMMADQSTGEIVYTTFSTEELTTLTDPNLRYALCLQDAANAVGMIKDSEFESSGHFVSVYASGNGSDSTLYKAIYSGITSEYSDTFMDNLRRNGKPTVEALQ